MTSQMKRTAVSVPANIVEGSARKHKNEYLHFLYTSIGSLVELGYYIKFSREVGYLDKQNFDDLNSLYEQTIRTLRSLINFIEKSKV